MDFKNVFIEKAKIIYKKSVNESEPFKNANQLILNYFNNLKDSLKKEIEVACGELDIYIDPIDKIVVVLDERELFIYLDGDDNIPIILNKYDFNAKTKGNNEIDRLEFNPEDKKYYGNKSKEELTNDLLDDYLRIAFDEELDALLASPLVD